MCNTHCVYYGVFGQTIMNIIVADVTIVLTVVEQLEITNCKLTFSVVIIITMRGQCINDMFTNIILL